MTKPKGSVLVAGSANIDFVVRAAHIPAPGETVLGGDLRVVPGGKGANQAVACARAGGAPTAMLVALGDDPFAPIAEASLREAGVVLHIVRSERATGAALITVSDDAENAITVAPGANMVLAPADLPDLTGVEWLAMQLETPLATVHAYARAARAAGVGVMLNAAPAQALSADLLQSVDLLVANEAELTAIVGGEGSIADQLARAGVATAVVTLGARGCCAWDGGSFIVQPAFSVSPVDTTAAGDTFCGVLAAELAGGNGLATAIRAAAAAGALATIQPGAQSSIPDRAALAGLLEIADDPDAVAALRTYCGVPAASQ